MDIGQRPAWQPSRVSRRPLLRVPRLWRRLGLRTRLFLLVLVACLPSLLVLAYLQFSLKAERHQRLSEDVMREVELLNADVSSTVESARQLTTAISRTGMVQHADPDCHQLLTELRGDLPQYVAMSVYRGDGSTVCTTKTEPPAPAMAAAARKHVEAVIAEDRFDVGTLFPASGALPPYLPLCLPFTFADGSKGVVAVGLSLDWFSSHLGQLRRPPNSTLGIADSAGTTIARFPDAAAWIGKPFPPGVRPFIAAEHRGTAAVMGYDGKARLIGYIPPAEAPAHLFVSVGFFLPDLLADVDRATDFATFTLLAGAAASVLLALWSGERLIRRPTSTLLGAAGRWARGDFEARAALSTSAGSEFEQLAEAFNGMAEALGRQRDMQEQTTAELERMVAARTRDLVDALQRLREEMREREKSEASLLQAHKLQAVGQLAGGIAHDFNNVLAIVIGSLDLVAREPEMPEARLMRHVRTAVAAAESGAKLTRQLLAFSRRQVLSPAPVDIGRVLESMRNLLASTLGRSITVELSLAADLPPAMIDPNFVESAILNLAVNARDAMPTGGTLTITTALLPDLVIGARAAADYVAVAVADTGTGMPPEIVARAFEPFFTTKPPGKGSGLGLSQVHGLVTKSGGDVRIDSVPGQGSTVTLILPRALDLTAVKGRAVVDAGRARARARVLLVDDDATIRGVVGETLERNGHAVLAAPDAAEALALIERGAVVDLLVTDYVMPVCNGLDLIRAARAVRPGLAALLITGHAELEERDLPGDVPVLRKPFPADELEHALQAALPVAPNADAHRAVMEDVL